jgi:hypothetical protein
MVSHSVELVLTPERTIRALFLTVFVLLIGHLAALYTKYIGAESYGMLWVFHFDSEANIPALYSFVIFVVSGALLWATGSLHIVTVNGQTRFWKILSCLWIIAAVDELTGFHQILTIDSLQLFEEFTFEGYLYFKWIMPYSIFFVFVSVFLIGPF